MTDTDETRDKAEAFIRRSYRTRRIAPLVGIKEVLLVLDIDKMTIYRWMEPGSDPAATEGALAVLEAAGVVSREDVERCMPSTVRANGARVNRAALADLIARLHADANAQAVRLLSDTTHMIPAAVVGAGEEYAAALTRRAAALKAELDELAAKGEPTAKIEKRIAAIDAALIENEKSDAGRAVWLLEDVERFGVEIGRIRAPVGKAKARR